MFGCSLIEKLCVSLLDMQLVERSQRDEGLEVNEAVHHDAEKFLAWMLDHVGAVLVGAVEGQ